LSGVPDVITHAKFYVNRSSGFSGCSSPKSAISCTYSNDPYNSSALPCRLWSVRLSIRLSQSWSMPKRFNILKCLLHRPIERC